MPYKSFRTKEGEAKLEEAKKKNVGCALCRLAKTPILRNSSFAFVQNEAPHDKICDPSYMIITHECNVEFDYKNQNMVDDYFNLIESIKRYYKVIGFYVANKDAASNKDHFHVHVYVD